MINKLAEEIHENAKSKGFFDSEKNIGEMLCLIHSEVSEALEADRKSHYAAISLFDREFEANKTHGKDMAFDIAFKTHIKNSFEDELADVMIRVMDLAAFKGIDLEYHINMKMKYNSMREHKHMRILLVQKILPCKV